VIAEAPRIETDRLVLRAWRKDDFSPWHDILHEDEVARFLGGTGGTKEDVWRRLAGAVGSWPLLGFGGWAVTLKGTGELVGTVGLFNAWRALEPAFGEEPEMGWIFKPAVQGLGLASEATRAVLGWAQANLEPTPVWAIIHPENEASMRLAARLGFEPVGEVLYEDEPTLVLKRPAWH
jgi:RimJ/RimL family protein N-acetyltransferase